MIKIQYNIEEFKKEALKYKTRTEFSEKNLDMYRLALKQGIIDSICKHMDRPKNKPYTVEELHLEALKYKTRGEFQKYSNGAYQVAKNRKILDQVCSHMVVLRHSWTFEELQREALKYEGRMVFFQKNPNAYSAALKRGIMDEICIHMSPSQTKAYTVEELRQEALKYKTKSEFENGSSGAYSAALKRDDFDQICSHMKISGNSSIPEMDILAIIKSIYPQAQKLRDRKIKIDGKPYIHGFDIDIYIPELNMGIEFDGRRYHSFAYMRKNKSKRKWPDEDIRNYHEIKDAWFASKGIKLLHIKEEDWIEHRGVCLDKCLKFLTKI